MKRITTLVATGLLFILSISEVQAKGFEPENLTQRIQTFVESIDPINRPSGVLLIAVGDSIVFHEAYGMADYENSVPNNMTTRFGIASITKEMTRLVAWQLLVEGKLGFESPLSTYIPDFPRGDEITVGQLMQHRAGIPHRVMTQIETSLPMTAEKIARRAADQELLATLGVSSSYSSGGYSVLARVVEIAEGKNFSAVLQERIFGPAKMTNSFDVDGRVVLPYRARSYVPGRDHLLNAPLQDLSYLIGAGSVTSTAEDLHRFFVAYKNNVFGEDSWISTQADGKTRWIGATNGFHSFLDHDPDTKVTIVFTSNTYGGGAGQLHDVVAKLVAGEEVVGRARPAEWVEVAPSRLAEYVGEYERRPGSLWAVTLYHGQLMISDSVVLPLSDTEFYFQNWAMTFSFVKDEATGKWGLRGGDESATVWPRVDSQIK